MPNEQGKGFVDYVLWGDDGKPLGAGRGQAHEDATRASASSRRSSTRIAWRSSSGSGRSSSTRTATSTGCGTTPAIRRAPVQGFYKKAELELLIQRRDSRKPLADAPINEAIVERYYQTRAIRRIGEAFEQDRDRKALRGHGDRRGQDAHGHRAVRSADAVQLGQAGAVPRRPRGAGEPGGQRVQEAPARCLAGEPRHREGRRGPGLRLDLSDDDGVDRRGAATASAVSASATSIWSSSTRRTARCTRSTAPSSTTSTRCWWA